MLRVLSCLVTEHNWWLVVLAGLVCFISSYSVIDLGRHARSAHGVARLLWIAMAGLAGGFGIWATHFIAMLAYDPGVPIAYDLGTTVVSLVIAVAFICAGIAVAIWLPSRAAALSGGAIVGLGVGSMHYIGMAAMELPARIDWAYDLIAASILIGAVMAGLALIVARRRQDATGALQGALVLTLAIVSLHFTGMGAVTVTPDPTRGASASAVPTDMLAYGVAVAAMLLVGLGLFTALVSRRARAATAAGERMFRILVEGVRDYALYLLKPDGRVANWNEGAHRIKGYAAEEIVGQHFSCFYEETDRAAGLPQQALETALNEGTFEAEGWRVRKDGSRFWAHVVIGPIRDEAGRLVGFSKITRDITARKASQDSLRKVSHQLDLALTHMSQGLALFDPGHRLVLANGRLAQIFSLPAASIEPGMPLDGLLARLDGDAGDPARTAALGTRHLAIVASGSASVVTEEFPGGRSISLSYRPIADGSFVVTFEDITERRRSEARIAHMARHDALTGLPNRLTFKDHLQRLIAEARGEDRIAVIGIDLDRFKEINDLRGHGIGDLVLQTLARRMSEVLRDDEFVARLGGDEFAAVKRMDDEEDLIDFLGRLEAALFAVITIDDMEIQPGASIGVALFPEDGRQAEQLVNNSDLAMYRAKAAIGQNICFYEAQMDEAVRRRRKLAKELRLAFDAGQFSLHYQVQKSVTTGETTGYEVLLRWTHPERGLVPPSEFIPVAEESGMILALGEWVLRTASAEAARWLHPYRIAVNLSPLQLSQADFVERLRSILAETGLAPSRLELEITESAIISDKERALHMLREMKALGVTVAIDDFGTGYSSLETLRAFPFDKIKLDRSFMLEVETSQQAKAIIRAILALGRSLEVPVLAEGVETADQLMLLSREGCNEAQGFLLGRPKPVDEIDSLMATASPPLAPDEPADSLPERATAV
ncbi:bifunctional diguanylate cyclase/phosphodiesterase [Phreatobacter sp.]|uniref:bifunctional diguanylate cyclase/phosphodiesterase n=1 Tax=Phreatobacter sp. TaxID=1966341 RepID=UPI003F72DEFD